jgi:arylsulfatase A-like enzyme
MRVYYAMTANLDWNIGRLQGAIQDAGIEGDTLFVFTSDHGECFGAHGRMKKNIFYEEAIRVPLLIKWPGVVPAGHRSDACFNCVDIMPTLLGFVGAQIPKEVEGMDLSHCARGEPGPEPAFAFLQNTGACADWEDGHEWRAIRTPQYTFAVYRVDGKELLFDHRKDPYQLHNLADRPGSAGLISELRAAMQVRMTELNDDFEVSSYYRDHWISRDRCILQTARSGPA